MSKSPKNKTIDTTVEEGREYLKQCIDMRKGEVASNTFHIPKDSTVIGDMMEACQYIPEKSVDLIIADPPYNLDKNYNGSRFKSTDAASYEEYTRKWLKRVKPLLKDNGSIYVCCDWKSSMVIGGVMDEMFHLKNRITWQREKGRGAASNWKNSMEDIWFATAGREYTFNIDDVKIRRRVLAPYRDGGVPKDWEETGEGNFRNTHPSNFWDDLTVPFWSMAENTAHPTQKPEKLMAKLILASSNRGDTVFDPFLGSGTSSVAAYKLGRHFIGIEREERYCIWARQRLERAATDKSIQGYADGVFRERNYVK